MGTNSRWLAVPAVGVLVLFALSSAPAMAGTGTSSSSLAAVKPVPAPGPAGGVAKGAVMAPSGAAAPLTLPPAPPVPAGTRRACAEPARIGQQMCYLLLRGAAAGRTGSAAPDLPVSGAYSPADLQGAYNLAAASASDGAGTTVAIVDAYADPKLVSDVATYRAEYGLPACDATTGDGCVTVVGENGKSAPTTATDPTGGWEAEQAADAEMVSAICPLCKIVMVEANSASASDLGTAENSAVNVVGAKFVSSSWGGFDFPGESYQDAEYYNHPGTALVFASGDAGYGPGYPASSQLVTSVGGTYLQRDSAVPRGWTESVWNDNPASVGGGTAAGCSAGEGKPSWQADPGCANRTANDVSAVASGPDGISVYDSFTACPGGAAGDYWCAGFGTSIAAPIITAVYALAGTPAPRTYPASYLYQSGHAAGLYPVKTGSDGTCESNRLYLCDAADSLPDGYNGPAGWGTPDGIGAFKNTATSNIVSVYNPGNIDIEKGIFYSPVTPIGATDSAAGEAVKISVTNLPPGLVWTGTLINGTASATGTYTVTATATDSTGASAKVSFTIGVTASLETSYHPGTGAVPLDWAGKCMDDTNNSSANGTKIQIWSCLGDASQNWAYYPDTDPGGAGELVHNGKCLDIVNRGTANGSRLQLWSCTGGANQQWYIIGGAGELYNPVSGKCIDDPYSSTVNGRQLDIWSCNGEPWQAWTLPASPVLSGISGKCVDDTNGSSANGNKIQLWTCNGLSTQRLTVGLNGSLRVAGKCLDATGYGTEDGTKIQLWSCTGNTNQEWVPVAYGMLENVNAEKCLADPSNTTANGTQLVLEDCYGQQGEVWAES